MHFLGTFNKGFGNRPRSLSPGLWIPTVLFCSIPFAEAIHHMKRSPVAFVNQESDVRPLVVTNQCSDIIYPGIATQAGTAPASQGFKLNPGQSISQNVSADWQGRVWGRTNCSFSANTNQNAGQACGTGDCGGRVDCQGTGDTPVTLAEFTLLGSGQTFYDISLVDGYNIPIAIVSLCRQSNNATLEDIPPNLTNPVCIGTGSLLQEATANTVAGDLILGTNASFPLPLDQSQNQRGVQQWCPWDLQLQPPQRPGDGVYPYPDSDIDHPDFDPCFSACAKYNDPQDCCTGAYSTSATCLPNYYSQAAKAVCPDAYSYAYDDSTSTFVIPSGCGFEVVLCPAGRSTNIQNTMGPQLRLLGQEGVTPLLLSQAMNATLIKEQSGAATLLRRVARNDNGLFLGLVGGSPHVWIATSVVVVLISGLF